MVLWKTLFFIQTYRYPEVFCNCHVAAIFKTSVLKEVCILHPLSHPLSPQEHYNPANTTKIENKPSLYKRS